MVNYKIEKLETFDNSLQIVTANCMECNIEDESTDFIMELSLEKRKKDLRLQKRILFMLFL